MVRSADTLIGRSIANCPKSCPKLTVGKNKVLGFKPEWLLFLEGPISTINRTFGEVFWPTLVH